MYSDQKEGSVFVAEQIKYVPKYDSCDDRDGTYLTSFRMEFQT